MKFKTTQPFAACVAVALVCSCATTDLLGNFNLISPNEETKLGRDLAGQIATEKEIVEDPDVRGYINNIGTKLVEASTNPNGPYTFLVVKDETVNAFAIPGGYLYVQTGLISAAESEAEIAAVMAHELGHAEQRHPTESLSRQMGAKMVMDIVLGKDAGQYKQQAANLLMAGGISAYSRSAELQADEIAVYVLNRAGYDPNAMVSFFEKLVALEQQAGASGGMTLFASHPPTQERINAAKNLIASFGAVRSDSEQLVGGFENIQNKVKQLH
ncbi:MAG: M48 family metalloprotease [Candidatus Hinthialibacter antarcticus]|nr:M48 family metalloprotease [Candidatus Hinthialibacter antarcticus]